MIIMLVMMTLVCMVMAVVIVSMGNVFVLVVFEKTLRGTPGNGLKYK